MLVDLPGVTIIPVRECAINPMISNVGSRTSLCSISCAKSHNLGVIVANAQLADSDGLKMAIEPEVGEQQHTRTASYDG
ncbi:hypothetical protein BS47DRAFT_1350391 [Hydnum rufescens UP504]|uniref:Uncharacterized protein n=1 Tax=Hydnum rufescens UP504 TaxID=1448309 RepID=A0A9P6AM42_9AGAM|nr:hypothetical protein BS47DRAFT_1350391 [Hydnum rufescens UP504]